MVVMCVNKSEAFADEMMLTKQEMKRHPFIRTAEREGEAMPWIEEHVRSFIPQIAELGVADEAEMARLCHEEIETWRARGLAQASLNSPMTAMRKAIKGLSLTEANSWVNEKQEREHIALKYMNFSKEEWGRIKGSTKRTVMQRLGNQRLIEQPEDLVRITRQLLERNAWPELAVGVLAASGRRLSEGLVTAQFARETAYTVLFTGQLKQPVADLSYEIPVLVEADLLVAALERLRQDPAFSDASTLTLGQVAHRYGPKVREAAREVFGDILPVRAGKQQLAAHDLRAAYARICVHWYCPFEKSDRLYAATILGHLQGDISEEEAYDRMQVEEAYADYLIGDGQGNVNGAKGIKLGEPGVVVLKEFAPKPEPVAAPKEESAAAEPSKKKRRVTEHSILNVDKALRAWVLARKKAGMTESDVVRDLIKQAEAPGLSVEHLDARRLGVSEQEVQEIREAVALTPEEEFWSFVGTALLKEAHIRLGTAKRTKKIEASNLTQMSTSKLNEQPKSTAWSQERIRRGAIAIMLWNAQQSDPKRLVSLTQNAIHEVTGARFDAISAFLKAHAQEIAQYHASLPFPIRRSGKLGHLGVLIPLPEEAEVYGLRFLEPVE